MMIDQDLLDLRNKQIDYKGHSDISIEDCQISEEDHLQP